MHLLLDQLLLESCGTLVGRIRLHILYLVLSWFLRALALNTSCMLIHMRASSAVLSSHLATSVDVQAGSHTVIYQVLATVWILEYQWVVVA